MSNLKSHRKERWRENFRSCKYCYNTPKRGQGLCSACLGRTKDENKYRYRLLLGYETLTGFLVQSNISEKNIKTIQLFLDASNSPPVVSDTVEPGQSESPACGLAKARSAFVDFATIILEISQNFPRKKRRIKRIKDGQPELYDRMKQQPNFDWYFDEFEVDIYDEF